MPPLECLEQTASPVVAQPTDGLTKTYQTAYSVCDGDPAFAARLYRQVVDGADRDSDLYSRASMRLDALEAAKGDLAAARRACNQAGRALRTTALASAPSQEDAVVSSRSVGAPGTGRPASTSSQEDASAPSACRTSILPAASVSPAATGTVSTQSESADASPPTSAGARPTVESDWAGYSTPPASDPRLVGRAEDSAPDDVRGEADIISEWSDYPGPSPGAGVALSVPPPRHPSGPSRRYRVASPEEVARLRYVRVTPSAFDLLGALTFSFGMVPPGHRARPVPPR